MQPKTLIFTDGAAKGNPGPGGYGVVIAHAGTITEKGGFKDRTTNNEMELKAVVEALKEIPFVAARVAKGKPIAVGGVLSKEPGAYFPDRVGYAR